MATTFETREVAYNGPERRHMHRRQNSDRRVDIRFEINNSDRRQLSGRRRSDINGWIKSTI